MGTGHADADGFCCSSCAQAAARGLPSDCDGESCGTGKSTAKTGRPSGCLTCGGVRGYDPNDPRWAGTGATGCACGMARPNSIGQPAAGMTGLATAATAIEYDTDPMLARMPTDDWGSDRTFVAGNMFPGNVMPQVKPTGQPADPSAQRVTTYMGHVNSPPNGGGTGQATGDGMYPTTFRPVVYASPKDDLGALNLDCDGWARTSVRNRLWGASLVQAARFRSEWTAWPQSVRDALIAYCVYAMSAYCKGDQIAAYNGPIPGRVLPYGTTPIFGKVSPGASFPTGGTGQLAPGSTAAMVAANTPKHAAGAEFMGYPGHVNNAPRGTGRATGRGTGALSLMRPPIAPDASAFSAALGDSGALGDRFTAWNSAGPGETSFEQAGRSEAFAASLRRSGESEDAWLTRLRLYYTSADNAMRAAGDRSDSVPGAATRWFAEMVRIGWLPPGALPTPAGVPPASGGGGSVPTASDASVAMANTARRVGETDATWTARINAYYATANAGQRNWITNERLANRLDVVAGGTVPRVAGVAAGTSAPAATTVVRPATNASDVGVATAIALGVTSALATAGGTILALVREANRADAEARLAAAQVAADAIARQTGREAQLIAAATAAAQATFDGQAAARLLAGGDRVGAVAKLSEGQGRLAAAMGASAVPAIGSNSTLQTHITAATSELGTAARRIDSTAPVGTPLTSADLLNAQNSLLQFNAQTAAMTPWYATPLAIGGAIAVGIGTLAAAVLSSRGSGRASSAGAR